MADVVNVIKHIEAIVSPVFMVGGSVRDILIGREPKDYDFTTPLYPQAIEDSLRKTGYRPYLIGKKFGTIGFKLDGRMIEVTSFRGDQYESGNRHPIVTFGVNLEEDLSRRDFTINAMAMDSIGNIIDPFDGKRDIEDKLIRAVGNPNERFNEDSLRILRAFRLAAELGFEIEPQTYAAIETDAHLILDISKERIMSELNMLVVGSENKTQLENMFKSKVMAYIIPELYASYLRSPSVVIASLITAVNQPKDLALRWATILSTCAIFLDVNDINLRARDEIVRHISLYLKWSKQLTNDVLTSLDKHKMEPRAK